MPDSKPEPLYNAGRRLKFLAAFIVLGAAAFTGLWYYAAGRIDTAAAELITQKRQAGTEIDCPSREVRGYPFRFGIFCDSLSVRDADAGAVMEAGALRSAAQFYEPMNIIAELDGPIRIKPSANAEPVTVNLDNARAAIHLARPFPEQVSVTSAETSMDVEGRRLGSAQGTAFHVRINPENNDDLDLAARLQELSLAPAMIGETELPLFDMDFDMAVTDGVARASTRPILLADLSGTLRRFALLLNDDAGLIVSGPYDIDAQGNLSGEFALRIVDADAVFEAAGKALPSFANQIGLLRKLPKTGEKGDEIELTLSVDKGRMRFGLIPLGKLPPFPPALSR